MKHGKGTYTFASGDVIDATWKKDVCISGTYKYVEDKRVGSGKTITSVGTKNSIVRLNLITILWEQPTNQLKRKLDILNQKSNIKK